MNRRQPAPPATSPIFWLIASLILCLVGGFGAAAVKTGGFTVDVKQISWETPEGNLQAGQLFVPPNATADSPAPAVVAAHGGSLNSEYPDQYYIELARRGYVVYAIDMYDHGKSDSVTPEASYAGVYDGVQYLATLPYVDSARIGVTGNSNGALAVANAILTDEAAAEPLIASALYVVNDVTTTANQIPVSFHQEADTDYINVFGSRDVGLITAEYDLTFNRVMREDGTVSAPRDFIHQSVAQSFLHFGVDPQGLEERESHVLYREDVNGEEAIRVLYDEPIIHPWSPVDPNVAAASIEFFEASLPAPHPLDPGDQVWAWKTVFSAIAMIGLFMFVVSLTLALLRTRVFGVLKATEPVEIREVDRAGKGWLWAGMLIAGVISGLAFTIIFWVTSVLRPAFFAQGATFSLGAWALFSGLVTLLLLVLNYKKYAKKRGLDLRAEGVVLARGTVWKTLSLSVLVSAAMYGIVFVNDWLFRTDIHVWTVLGFNTFGVSMLLESLKYLPFFVVFFVIMSVATNVFNYVRIGRHEWVNLTLMAIFNTLGALLLFAGVYGYFFVTGSTPLEEFGLALFTPVNVITNVLVIIPIATVVTRLIYKETRNPYLGGLIMAIIATLTTATRALTLL